LSAGYLLWRFRTKLSSANVGYGFCALVLFLWLLAGDPLINTVMVWVVATCYGTLNTPITVIYGFCALGLIQPLEDLVT